MGQNNRANRQVKKRRLLKQKKAISGKNQGKYKALIPLMHMAMKVSGGDKLRTKYFFEMAMQFLRDEISMRDFVFFEEELARRQDFCDMLIFMQQVKNRMLEGKSTLGERELMEIEEVLEQSDTEWRECAVV